MPQSEATYQREHTMLLYFLLLPLHLPAIAVWIRTMVTAGITAPFDGDHNLFMIVPFLLFANFAATNSSDLLVGERRLSRYAIVT